MTAVNKPTTPAPPPITGVAEIDAALATVRLDGPVDEALQQALRSPLQ